MIFDLFKENIIIIQTLPVSLAFAIFRSEISDRKDIPQISVKL